MIDLGKLKELRAKATPGPWSVEAWQYNGKNVWEFKFHQQGRFELWHVFGCVFADNRADAPHTAALIALAPDLADEVLRLTTERDAAVAASQALAAENARLNAKISEVADGLADFVEELMRLIPELGPFRVRLADSVSALRFYAKGGDK